MKTEVWKGDFFAGSADKRTVFVRPCYQPLFEMVLEGWATGRLRNALVLGTPGIGKTFFLNYVARKLLSEENRSFDVVIDTGLEAAHISPDNIVFPGGSAAVVNAFSDVLSRRETILLYDCYGSQAAPADLPCKALVTSSPNAARYHDYRKHACNVLTMPVWQEDELELCRTACFPEQDVESFRKRLLWWGGIPRYTIGESTAFADMEMDSALQRLDVQATKIFLETPGVMDLDAGKISHRLLHFHTRDFRNFWWDFASPAVRQRVLESLRKNVHFKAVEFIQMGRLDPNLSVLGGHLFEAAVHALLMKREYIEARPLNGSTNASVRIDLNPRAKYVRFTSLEQLQVDTYCVPEAKNHGACDSVFPPRCMFQVTVAAKHSISLSNVLELLGSDVCKDIKMIVFVVPEEIAGTYKKQPFTEGGNVVKDANRVPELRQLVLGVSDEELKRAWET